jgi:SAM-dependent methyltransferase
MEVTSARTSDPKDARFLRDDEFQHETVGGREYILESRYILSTDDEDIRRLNDMHHMFKDMLHGLYMAPLKKDKVRGVLEVCHGSGIWAVEMAAEFPQAKVFAFDIRTNPVPFNPLPPNLLFQRADLTKGLPYMSKSFDYIHQRCGGLTATYDQFLGIFEEYYRVLRPGGYVEILEVNCEFRNSGPITERIFGIIRAVAAKRGVICAKLGEFDVLLKKAGFNKVVKNDSIPYYLGTWIGKEKGTPMFDQVNQVAKGIEPLAVQLGLCEPNEITELCKGWEEECNTLKTTQYMFVYTAKKSA